MANLKNLINKILDGAVVRDVLREEYIPDITDRYPEGMYDLSDDREDVDFEPVAVKDVIKDIESDDSFCNCINVWRGKKKVGEFYKLNDLKKFVNDFVHNWRWIDATIDLYLVESNLKESQVSLVSESNDLEKDFENWWESVKDDFMSGGEEFFGFDPDDANVTWGVNFLDDGSVVLFGDVNGVGLTLNDFKDLLKSSGINVGTDVIVSKDSYTVGFKVDFVNITPEEFLKKVW